MVTRMKILITGADGQVGQALLAHTTQATGLSRQQCDIGQVDQISQSIDTLQPDIVINCAAYTAVDQAEQQPELADKINHLGAKYLAQVCHRFSIPLIHLSTDYVFCGNHQQPYRETDPCQPINVYGQSKLAGELAIQAVCPQHIILRTSSVFSYYRQNFLLTMLKLLREKSQINVINNQWHCPTAAMDLAQVILQMAKQAVTADATWGIYHYCNQEQTTWYDFACQIKQQLMPDSDCELLPIASEDYPALAKRPRYSVLDCQKMMNQFAITPAAWSDFLNLQ